jgi:hypothetical protein
VFHPLATLPCVFGSRNAVGEVFVRKQIFCLFENIDYHSARSGVQQSNRLVVLWSLDQKWPRAVSLVCGERDFRDIIHTTLAPPWNRGHGQVQGRTSHNPILLAGNRRSGRGGRGWSHLVALLVGMHETLNCSKRLEKRKNEICRWTASGLCCSSIFGHLNLF